MKIVKTNLIYFESGLQFVCLCKDNDKKQWLTGGKNFFGQATYQIGADKA